MHSLDNSFLYIIGYKKYFFKFIYGLKWIVHAFSINFMVENWFWIMCLF